MTKGKCFSFPLWLLFLFGISGLFGCGGSSGSPASQQQTLQAQLMITVTGEGSVISSPAGINCPTACAANFPSGTTVTITANAGTGFSFGGFGGACSGSTCQLVLSSNQSVSATFTPIAAQLTVTVSGSGTITSNPAGIKCPSTCTANFTNGASVSLTASAAPGFIFSGFGGACSGLTCQLVLFSGQTDSVSATFSSVPPGRDITAIHHVIVMLQENRSFDHYFGHLSDYWQAHGFPQATNGTTLDGEPGNASNIDPSGSAVVAYNLQSACLENPSPSWNESHVDRNRSNPTDSGAAPMDGFVQTAAGDASGTGLYDVLGHRAMSYYVGDNQLNYYYFMASNFATSDRWFSPVFSRTHPNRMYLYAATSAGHVYPLNGSPALTNETIFQLLQANGISWKIYVHPDASGCATPACLAGYSYLSQFTYGQYVLSNMPNQYAPTTQLMLDIQNGTLPQVAFIEPAGYVALDEHAAGTDTIDAASVQTGAAYVESIVDALMASPSWQDSVFILSYDEGGGFYDHVPPQPATPPDTIQYPTDLLANDVCTNNTSPICGFFVTGFRVPLMVISPFTRKNYVSHTAMDYTAILKFIETRFNLPSLTSRDAAQPDMTEFFDFPNMPWANPPTPPKQVQNLPCVLESLNAVTISPNPASAGGPATVTLSLVKSAIQDTTVSLSSNPSGVVPASAVIANGTSSTTLNITVPTGVTSLTVTGAVAGMPVSGTVPVQ